MGFLDESSLGSIARVPLQGLSAGVSAGPVQGPIARQERMWFAVAARSTRAALLLPACLSGLGVMMKRRRYTLAAPDLTDCRLADRRRS